MANCGLLRTFLLLDNSNFLKNFENLFLYFFFFCYIKDDKISNQILICTDLMNHLEKKQKIAHIKIHLEEIKSKKIKNIF